MFIYRSPSNHQLVIVRSCWGLGKGRAGTSNSKAASFATAPIPLDPPILEFPLYNATQVALRPTFEWRYDGGQSIDHYTWQLHTVDDFSSPLMQQAGLTDTTYQPPTDLDEETGYYWRVIAYTATDSAESVHGHFTTLSTSQQPLSAPTLDLPLDGAQDVARQPTFEWSHPMPEEVDSYTLQIDEAGGDFTQPLHVRPGLPLDPYMLDVPLVPETSYAWRVVAVRGQEAAASAPWRLTTEPSLALTPSPLDFGSVPVATSDTLTVTLENSGSTSLMGTFAMADTTQTVFVFLGEADDHTGTFSLSASGARPVQVQFTPPTVGAYSETVTFVEDGSEIVLATLVVRGEGGGGTPTEQGRYYYLKDHLGSVRATIDETGQVVQYDDYYPFGAQMPGRSSMSEYASKERFTGYEYDDETWDVNGDGLTGHYYAGARYYDPVIPRFNAPDRFQDKYPSLSPYSYAANNPVNLIDVNGDSIYFSIHQGGRASVSRARIPQEGMWDDPEALAALGAFLQTEEGYNFLAQFAAKGQTIEVGGSTYTFGEDGKYVAHGLELIQSSSDFSQGLTGYFLRNPGEGRGAGDLIAPLGLSAGGVNEGATLHVQMSLSTAFDKDTPGLAISLGHEAFIHAQPKVGGLISALSQGTTQAARAFAAISSGSADHRAYLSRAGSFPAFGSYVNQLRGLYPAYVGAINSALRRHDANLRARTY